LIHSNTVFLKIATQTISNIKGFHIIVFIFFLYFSTPCRTTCIHALSCLKIQSRKGAQKEIILLFCPVEETFDTKSAPMRDDLGYLLNLMGLSCQFIFHQRNKKFITTKLKGQSSMGLVARREVSFENLSSFF
jgi:hypothetical protein